MHAGPFSYEDLPKVIRDRLERDMANGQNEWLRGEMFQILNSGGIPATIGRIGRALESGKLSSYRQDSACNNHYSVDGIVEFAAYIIARPNTGRPRKPQEVS